MSSILKEGGLQRERGKSRRSFPGPRRKTHELGCGVAKTLHEDLRSCDFTTCQAKPEIRKEIGRQRAYLYNDRVKRARVTGRGGGRKERQSQ